VEEAAQEMEAGPEMEAVQEMEAAQETEVAQEMEEAQETGEAQEMEAAQETEEAQETEAGQEISLANPPVPETPQQRELQGIRGVQRVLMNQKAGLAKGPRVLMFPREGQARGLNGLIHLKAVLAKGPRALTFPKAGLDSGLNGLIHLKAVLARAQDRPTLVHGKLHNQVGVTMAVTMGVFQAGMVVGGHGRGMVTAGLFGKEVPIVMIADAKFTIVQEGAET
jgi:hypothetical protein